jgi:hypothetical protein
MSDTSAILSLPLLQPAQAQKHVTHNEALTLLDMLVQSAVASRTVATPPATSDPGTCYIVAAGATGAWAGQDDALAAWDGSAWRFVSPQTGWRVYLIDEGRGAVWTGRTWEVDRPGLDNISGVGINAASDASLFSHDGAGHQIKVNKASAADTASLLFQTAWSGRAEMGLAGGDAFEIKTSGDGTTWTTALSLDPSTGQATGAAVQQGATDTTAGRLARADHVYGPGNLLGVVRQNGGTPTGAVLERGSNSNGNYVRFADGTQICQSEETLDYLNGAVTSGTWTFPATFAVGSEPAVIGNISADALIQSAPSVSPHEVTPLVLGAFSPTSASLQIRTLQGYAFQSDESVLLRVMAIGLWY